MPGLAGAYVATGHGPWGILNAPATALALAELIAGGAAATVDLRPQLPNLLRGVSEPLAQALLRALAEPGGAARSEHYKAGSGRSTDSPLAPAAPLT